MHTFLEADLYVQPRVPGSRKRNTWLAFSAILHGVLLVILCWGPGAIFVKPRLLAKGQAGSATPASMALYIPQDAASTAPHEPSQLSVAAQARQARNKKNKLQRRTNVLEREQPPDDREAGSPLGTTFDGAAEGDEVKQGFAIVYAPPHVSRSELPAGREADVVVELSIDAQGNVVEEKLLQGIGPGIDERVLAAVRDWHFRPATRNGIAIPFKYDARFHFPG
jgi:TonB family protein